MGAYAQLLPKGFATQGYRSSSGTVFAVIDGKVHAQIGDKRFVAEPNDVFVVPSWAQHSLLAEEESVVFSFSDRPVQEILGLWRESRS
jgi:gentisate 1,2-dioxygenase